MNEQMPPREFLYYKTIKLSIFTIREITTQDKFSNFDNGRNFFR